MRVTCCLICLQLNEKLPAIVHITNYQRQEKNNVTHIVDDKTGLSRRVGIILKMCEIAFCSVSKFECVCVCVCVWVGVCVYVCAHLTQKAIGTRTRIIAIMQTVKTGRSFFML